MKNAATKKAAKKAAPAVVEKERGRRGMFAGHRLRKLTPKCPYREKTRLAQYWNMFKSTEKYNDVRERGVPPWAVRRMVNDDKTVEAYQ